MSLDSFNKGGSVPRTITLTDADENALDTADFLTIEAKVFNKLHRGINSYTLADGEIIRLEPTSNGQIFFVVPEDMSSEIRALKYYIQITTTETNADYPNNIRTRIGTSWGFDLEVSL